MSPRFLGDRHLHLHLHHLPLPRTGKRQTRAHGQEVELAACLLAVEAARQPARPNTTHQHHPLSFHTTPILQQLSLTAYHVATHIQHRRASTQPDTRPCRAAVTASHSFTFLANPENPGLLAVVEQSATHHGLFVHAKEAKACALCISIPALHYRRFARRLRPRHLRGPSARIVITASTAHNEQRAKSR